MKCKLIGGPADGQVIEASGTGQGINIPVDSGRMVIHPYTGEMVPFYENARYQREGENESGEMVYRFSGGE